MTHSTIQSNARDDQKPGTSGLRKTTRHFQQPHFLERFIQAIFDATGGAAGRTFVIGGDGREWSPEAAQTIIRIAIANGAKQLLVGRDAILSTPAASNLIRKYKTDGGIILSASHNPGGLDGDFGVKFNGSNGGPASESVTEEIYKRTRTDMEIHIAETADIDLSKIATLMVGETTVKIVDPVADYVELMRELFDFQAIGAMIAGGRTLRFDAMHAVTGPYARAILEDCFGCPAGTVVKGTPLPDFGGAHPDPNPTWAKSLYEAAGERGADDIAAASDGDGDRNMIVGAHVYVTPSDSLAIICEHASKIPAYRNGLAGVARSMPTSAAVDHVAAELGIDCYVTPTGWKFFGNLMDDGRITLCGEESFGTGSTHVREKDGLWAYLCWLNIMAATGKSAADLVHDHWSRFGRTFYTRHDYEAVPQEQADAVVTRAEALVASGAKGITKAESFAYTDPVDGSLSTNQGYRFEREDGARIIMRLSGTGTVGATIRLYFEEHEADSTRFDDDAQDALADVFETAEQLLKVREETGRDAPDVVT